MKSSDLKGVYTATVTPVNKDRSLDTASMKALIDYYVDSGLRGALVPSSSGEYFSMTAEMKRHCVAEAVKAANGRFQILANVSDPCPEVIVANAKLMADLGADAVVCQPPQFHGYSQEEAIRFFTDIADRSPLPVILYNHMVTLPTKLAVETVMTICRHENVIGIKDTHRDPQRTRDLRAAMDAENADFAVMNGGDMTAAVGALCGFQMLNALSAIRPDLMTGILEAGRRGDVETAEALQEKVNRLCKIFSCLRGGMASSTLFAMALKLALEKKGLCGPTNVILGFEATDDDRKAVDALLASID